MKRIFSILVVVCLVVVMAVPISATSTDGTWSLHSTISNANFPTGTYDVNWEASDGSYGDKITLSTSNIGHKFLEFYQGNTRLIQLVWEYTGERQLTEHWVKYHSGLIIDVHQYTPKQVESSEYYLDKIPKTYYLY